ncbi:DUF2235 domain-containing protein [Devosia sp. SL43]|uniref:DUF2235 domain-containing protein n=1 Tax=Devosia sp. SL43 TaxID=2806348 RepID=UPI001F227F78|nr:DUF2235 domain-containing protein [Devosia sp. SL43]UJW86338.1 DUF2235 domain-containing protein [Devosia sp. SL43]
MKRIAIFCDGTWNTMASPEPTNVVIAARAVQSVAADGVTQVTYYNEGVGTTYLIAPGLEARLAGAFGFGLFDKIADAYRFLVLNYQPGDDIYIFGFSRGAYTARSLAGMIRKCGVLRKENAAQIGRAFSFYKSPDVRPSGVEAHRFRNELSHPAVLKVRNRTGETGRADDGDFSIAYLGVWDTVGALGIPSYLPLSGRLNGVNRYRFHDAELSSLIGSARHALAIDENRRPFEATQWSNLDQLNAMPGRAGNYQQLWFPGDHGSVGGGGDIRGLSNEALIWVVEGAREAGLGLDDRSLAPYAATRDFRAPTSNISTILGLRQRLIQQVIYPRAPRQVPKDKSVLSQSAMQRLAYRSEDASWKPYRPFSLSALFADLGLD